MTATTLNQNNLNSKTNQLEYAINSTLMNVNTILPCKILSIEDNRASIQSIINMLDATGNPLAYPVIHDVPFMQIVGGNAGVIIEHIIGDIVAVGFSQRDLSSIKATWETGNPASYRKFSLADAIILGKLSNNLPTIFIKITAAGVEIAAPDLPITATCQTATVNADQVDINSGNINLGSGGVGILNANTQFQVANVQSGSATLPVTIVAGTASNTVKATN